MARPRPLVLLWALLTLCISARTPKVWVQVQMEATELPTFTVRCGFLGSGSISLVTAHWETKSSISLTLEGSMAGSPWANTTICCKFISFPNGSQEACGDKGLPAPSPAPILKADLAGIFGASGVLLCGCIFLLHLVRRQRHRSVAQLRPPLPSSRAQRRAQATSQVALEDPHLPYTPATFHLAAPDTGHPHQQPSRWALPPIHTACPPQVPATRVSRLATPRSSFISVENGLYAGAGARPPCTGPNLGPSPDSLGPRVMGRHLEV
ncbi:transmembrane protein PVRIG isoform X2 [Sciurus carolinensis]|uniref:transmembrane protein PVRIG isoform X2 n=1 Tax=Sciurus carolinensis TaxID=30640 RepID=UPI001FB37514|nr:transmembrane protein PVRIG isoform X2 [Sciurus carolinensis]